MQDPQKKTAELAKGEMILWSSFFMKELPSFLQDTEESDWKIAKRGKIVSQISCFMKQICLILWACRLEKNAPMLLRNFGGLSRQ